MSSPPGITSGIRKRSWISWRVTKRCSGRPIILRESRGGGVWWWLPPAGIRVGVINLAGRVFMHPLDCPFQTADREIAKMKNKAHVIIVDMHAEATSEKIAMGWYLSGRVTAVLGTHTHVQTADDRILPGETAYITDVGMTGPFDSVIGIKKEVILQRFLLQIPNKFDVAKGDVRLQGVTVEIDPDGRAKCIERVNVSLKEEQRC